MAYRLKLIRLIRKDGKEARVEEVIKQEGKKWLLKK